MGRDKTTGKYESRGRLERAVIHFWQCKYDFAYIAELCEISPKTARRIIKELKK